MYHSTNNNTRSTALCSGLPGWVGTRKIKQIRILLKQETVGGSGITWPYASMHLAPDRYPRWAPQHSVFYGSDAHPAIQLCQSTESTLYNKKGINWLFAEIATKAQVAARGSSVERRPHLRITSVYVRSGVNKQADNVKSIINAALSSAHS